MLVEHSCSYINVVSTFSGQMGFLDCTNSADVLAQNKPVQWFPECTVTHTVQYGGSRIFYSYYEYPGDNALPSERTPAIP
jgi:hypothetical protein